MNRLKRIVGPADLAAGTLHTVPAFHTQTLRYVKMINRAASVVTVSIGIGGTADADLIIGPIDIAIGGTIREYMHITLEETETLEVAVSASGVTCTINAIDQD